MFELMLNIYPTYLDKSETFIVEISHNMGNCSMSPIKFVIPIDPVYQDDKMCINISVSWYIEIHF